MRPANLRNTLLQRQLGQPGGPGRPSSLLESILRAGRFEPKVDIPMKVLTPEAWSATRGGYLTIPPGITFSADRDMFGGNIGVDFTSRFGEKPSPYSVWGQFKKGGLDIQGNPAGVRVSYTKKF